MRFYFIRHGETEFNQNHIIQGRDVDSPLTQNGIQGAIRLGQTLAPLAFDKAYMSPQQRAMDTMNYILAENNHPTPTPLQDDRLRELYFGRFEGQPIAKFQENGLFDDYKNHPDTFDASTTKGETYYDLRDRGMAAMENIMAQCDNDDNIIIVAHSIFLTTLTRSLLGVPMKDIRKDGVLRNTSVTVIDIDKETKETSCLTFDYVPE